MTENEAIATFTRIVKRLKDVDCIMAKNVSLNGDTYCATMILFKGKAGEKIALEVGDDLSRLCRELTDEEAKR